MQLSVIIPCFNEADNIRGVLDSLLLDEYPVEVIVVDGGSTDSTSDVVRSYQRVHFIQSEIAGRSHQMNIGARRATGDSLLFLHADTRLPSGYYEHIEEVLDQDTHCGGSFRLRFDANHWLLTVVEYLTHLNLKWLTFGDHGMFFRAEIYHTLGGYGDMPVLEDLEFQLRARRIGKMPRIASPVTTSARRFVKNGVARQLCIDAMILLGYGLGIPADKLARLYPRHT